MHLAIEHFGVAVAAVTGVLAGRGKRVDLFGVMVLAVVTAFGGGTVRDLCLGSTPVFWIQKPVFLLNAVGVGVATFFFVRFREVPQTALQVADAFALAFFSIVGVTKSLLLGTSASIAVSMGVITGVVGGMIRDVLTGEIPLVFRQQIYLYATASLVGCLSFVWLRQWGMTERAATVVATSVILGLRLGALRWKLSLPEFEPAPPARSASSRADADQAKH